MVVRVIFDEAGECCRLTPSSLKAAPACRYCESIAVRSSSNDGRPPMVAAMQWVSRITTVSLEMALPAGLGYLADQRWGTEPWLTSVGALFGFIVGFWHLLQLVAKDQSNTPQDRDKSSK
jgi:F0F1-type ATP synthase assembly protein I